MKSKGLLLVGAMVVSSLVLSVVLLPEEKAQDDVFTMNVEALASGEGKVTCEPDKGDTCLVGSTPFKDYDEVDTWF